MQSLLTLVQISDEKFEAGSATSLYVRPRFPGMRLCAAGQQRRPLANIIAHQPPLNWTKQLEKHVNIHVC